MTNIDKVNISGDVVGGAKIIHGYTAEQVRALVSAALDQIRKEFQPKPFDGRCPYRGLEAFGEDDASYFFGRERLVTELVERVSQARCVVIAGPSGSGKSSLVRAGLIHALKRGALPHSDHWRYETLTPGRSPLDALARVASSLASRLNAGDDIRRRGLTDATLLHQWAEVGLGGERDCRALIVVDQFEETFTQVAWEDERAAFLNLLTHAATVESGRVTVLFVLRSDFVSNCATYPELNALLNQQFFQVGALLPDELVSAIARPALQVGLRIDSDLIAQIIADMQDEPGALPLMQFALKDLFDATQAASGVIALTLEGYLARGGLHKALERHADAAFAQLNSAEQEIARDIFTKLIQPGRGTQDTRRTVAFEELVPAGEDPLPVETVVQRLAEPHLRLITTDERDEHGLRTRTATIAHEKLIDAWPWLKRLVNENRESIALQNEIADDAQAWEQNRRDSSYLYVGARLATAREKLAAKQLALSELAQTFVDLSREAEEAARGARNRAIIIVGVLLLAAAIISVLFGFQSNANARQAQAANTQSADSLSTAQAEAQSRATQQSIAETESQNRATQQSIAETEAQNRATQQAIAEANLARVESLRLGAEANSILESTSGGNAETAALLSIRGLQFSYSPQANAALIKAASRLYTREQFSGHTREVMSVAFSPDGKYVLTGGQDNTARLWDVATGQQVRIFTGHIDYVLSVAFSPDGKYVLTGSQDDTARLWEAASGRQVRVFTSPTGGVGSVAFSPDGHYVLMGSGDTPRLWDANNGQEIRAFTGHTAFVTSVAFSPDGKYVLIGDFNNAAWLWDTNSGQEIHAFNGHTNGVTSVTFSPDGKYVLTGSYDGTARLWDTARGQEVRAFTGGTNWVSGVAFSSDGKYVLTGSQDTTARLWDVATGDEIRVFTGHTGGVWGVAFSPDGKSVLTGSGDTTARLWDLSAEPPLSEAGRLKVDGVGGIFFSPNGKNVLTWSVTYADNNATVWLWNATNGGAIQALTVHTDVWPLAFSPDGKYMLTWSRDKTIGLWDMVSGEEIRAFVGHTDSVRSVAFSPDGKYVLTGGDDKTARLWDVTSGQNIRTFTGHTSWVLSVAFSPDGKYVLTGGEDNIARLWDLTSGNEIRAFAGHTGSVQSVTFSPDSKYLLTGSWDTTARLWDTASGREIRTFIGHTDHVVNVAFSPDGKYVLTAGYDHTARLWDAANGDEIGVFIGLTDLVTSVAFSPDGRYVLTVNGETVQLWYADYHDFVQWVCSRLVRDLTNAERVVYSITDERATCEG